MINLKKKYSVFLFEIKTNYYFKSSVLLMILESAVPTITMIFLWNSVYQMGSNVGGYSFEALIIYFLGSSIINYFVWYPVDWEFNELVHSGRMGNLLTKPIGIQEYFFYKMIGNRFANIVIAIPIFLIIAFFLKNVISLEISFTQLILAVFSLFLTFILWFLMSICVGYISFWAENISFSLFVKEVLFSILAGQYFPLDILPNEISSILQLLPWSFLNFFPLHNFITHEMEIIDLVMKLCVQLFWIVFFFVISKKMSKLGIARYIDANG